MSEESRLNIVVVVSDTLRTAYLGCYGNREIRTPNIDRFAKTGVVFTDAYPESLPTIPVRRALHTARRAYPFRNWRRVPWDIVKLPGWQPMADEESTVAEDLVRAGYHTGFVTDTLPYFGPAMNFTRGFRQWEFVRGYAQDRWQSVHVADKSRVARFAEVDLRPPYNPAHYHVANTADYQEPEKTSTARTYQWAMKFLEDNAGVPFYLLVDHFAPHEPWEAPEKYYRMYANGSYKGRIFANIRYGPNLNGMTEEEVRDIVAHYSGLVTLVDDWFGQMMRRMEELGLAEKTVVIFTSDHGTNFGENLWRVVGKPGNGLLPGTMHLPLIVKDPRVDAAGKQIGGLRYNLDIPASVYDAAGASPSQAIQGRSLLPALNGDHSGAREYLTSRYDNTLWYRDRRWWVIVEVDRSDPHVFNLEADPGLTKDLAGQSGEPARALEIAWQRILEDAGGDLPDYRKQDRTDAVGGKQVGR